MASAVPVDDDPFAAPAAAKAVPVDHDPFAAAPAPRMVPEISLDGFPTGNMVAEPAGDVSMPYGEQMRHVGGAFLSAADRVAANLPFMDRATAKLNEATGRGDYDSELARIRAENEQKRKDNPVGEMIATGAGMAIPVGGAANAVMRGAGLGARMVRGALTGAGFGGVNALSNEEDLTNIDPNHIISGAATGGALGTAIPLGGAAIGGAARWIGNRLLPETQGLGNQAREYLTRQLEADDPARVQQRLAELGPLATPADAGPSLMGVAQGLASGPPGEARTLVGNVLGGRNTGTDQRLAADLTTNLGQPHSPQAVTDAILAQRQQAHAALPQIFQNAPPVNTSGILATIGQGLNTAVGPEARVLQQARNYLMQRGPTGALAPVTDAQTLQNAKAAIDMLIERGDPTLGVPAGALSRAQGSIGNVRAQLNQALRTQVPGYSAVMDRSAALARVADGIEAGKNSVLAGGAGAIHPNDYGRQFAALSPAERFGHQIGIRAAVEQAVGTKANDLQALRNLTQGENGWNAQKISTAFGQAPAQSVQDAIDREIAFRGTHGRVNENSQTAPRSQAVQGVQQALAPHGPLIPGNIQNVTTLGGPLEMGRKGINLLASALRRPIDPEAASAELARAVTSQGSARDELIRQLMGRSSGQLANAQRGERINEISQALMGTGAYGALAHQPQSR